MAAQLTREQLHTVQLVPLTAFDSAGQLHLEPMRQLIERLFAAGIRAFIPCAGSSEFHSLTADEIVASVSMVREAVGDEAVILAPIGLQLPYAVELGKRTLDAGADGVLAMPLPHPYLSDAGAADYYRALLKQVGCPTLIYKKTNIPSDELLLDLAAEPLVYGVKHAVNDIDAYQQLVQRDGGRIDWFCGSAERFAPFYALAGSPGYTSGAGNVCPRLTLAMHAALAEQNYTEALRLQAIIRPIEEYRARAASSYNISFLKHAITRTGLDFGAPRPPQRQLTDAEKREIDELLEPILAAEQRLAKEEVASS